MYACIVSEFKKIIWIKRISFVLAADLVALSTLSCFSANCTYISHLDIVHLHTYVITIGIHWFAFRVYSCGKPNGYVRWSDEFMKAIAKLQAQLKMLSAENVELKKQLSILLYTKLPKSSTASSWTALKTLLP